MLRISQGVAPQKATVLRKALYTYTGTMAPTQWQVVHAKRVFSISTQTSVNLALFCSTREDGRMRNCNENARYTKPCGQIGWIQFTLDGKIISCLRSVTYVILTLDSDQRTTRNTRNEAPSLHHSLCQYTSEGRAGHGQRQQVFHI